MKVRICVHTHTHAHTVITCACRVEESFVGPSVTKRSGMDHKGEEKDTEMQGAAGILHKPQNEALRPQVMNRVQKLP